MLNTVHVGMYTNAALAIGSAVESNLRLAYEKCLSTTFNGVLRPAIRKHCPCATPSIAFSLSLCWMSFTTECFGAEQPTVHLS